jgi:hypothetical protein
MIWEPLKDGTGISAQGRKDRYVIVRWLAQSGETAGVRLTRWPSASDLHDPFAEGAAAARNLIAIPLGRGPGRPAGEAELDGLFGIARGFAATYEGGQGLPSYPEWAPDWRDPGMQGRLAEFLARDKPRPGMPGYTGIPRLTDQAALSERLADLSFPSTADAYDITYRPGQDGGSADGCADC